MIDEEDTPPPVPDTPRRLQYDRNYDKPPSIPEEDERNGDKDNKFRRNKTIIIVMATKLYIYKSTLLIRWARKQLLVRLFVYHLAEIVTILLWVRVNCMKDSKTLTILSSETCLLVQKRKKIKLF